MIKKAILTVGLFAIAVLFLFSNISGQSKPSVPYPEGYRKWAHVKSMLILPGHPLYEAFGGIHHIYANDKAMRGYRTGKFPDGSVIVFDLLEAKSENNTYVEGARKVVGVMYKDSKKFKNTGGWGFEAFKGDTKERVVKNAEQDCFSCHASQEATDFVFSQYRK
ncbi:Cytochrome P460 [Candidatus Kryptonium thompsonii]|uniref:Cytochrome P460 n=1 Tax=Candidatus Kryptonium thompsonii TaxID=1633631 RepID=A0A0P1M163_9BACT|nr:cytochrome P460 family protein [Candidatus Kryptonium thompsoni]CUS77981.1 Cytochrome P460 [Candidatus Kryptonium thompsoni]CUS80481.1 Cytochrome P460 [Candidatus Kryptonium thompsoni]CUS82294.1 Cytochrome P460 [Candidatus Kryptonium thompsoni]CUS83301.1 Cytochrome P460 [Candidatus Kryptonium thompsoni]CUS85755.1 Cytochrome P460 [Candidatus Kryptonium thompsoni]